ncbi:cation:proton antiporter [Streptomyces sp. NBC_00347]|uniref:cation:proton antiporter n=1 Tax=Streptomyces sp. NBC_00347 TaxID=2975721 RepID=UPI00225748B3|nr:cation:proton antiporter [Streptomyces sp. NBC_00347]MCX5122870.1 cation:proton antiporter [Streptomyces sp. NBC_00347]
MPTELALDLPAVSSLSHLFLMIALIMVACRAAGHLCRRLGQPPVIGEIMTGIALGPSLLGAVWPEGQRWLFPANLLPVVNSLAQIGLVLFMFLVGYELNVAQVRSRGKVAALVSNVSVAVPMAGGILLAVAMYGRFADTGIGFPAFALFMALSMSITAFPVLARILTDRKMDRTPVGALALTCAAVDDITAWCLLALATALGHDTSLTGVVTTVALTAVFIFAMMYGLRPLLARLAERHADRLGEGITVLPLLLTGILLASFATDWIGIHPIFGAFLFGAVVPRGAAQAAAVELMRGFTVVLLLPLFFTYSGLKTDFRLIGAEPGLWGWCAVIVAVATVSKWAGSTGAARVTGLGWQEALSLGALMNCRGLTELVVLGVGLELGIITPTVFAMLVVMTLVTTVLTAPALTLIDRMAAQRRSLSLKQGGRAVAR